MSVGGLYNRLREPYGTEFHKPGAYRHERAWANARDLLCSVPSGVGRCRRAGVSVVVCFDCGGISYFRNFLLRADTSYGVYDRYLLISKKAFA